jgi:hypothetical protein
MMKQNDPNSFKGFGFDFMGLKSNPNPQINYITGAVKL